MSRFKNKRIEQEKARLADKVARLNEKNRKEENGQKIIIGGAMLHLAETDEDIAKILFEKLPKVVTREHDLKRITPILEELQEIIAENESTKLKKEYPQQGGTRANY